MGFPSRLSALPAVCEWCLKTSASSNESATRELLVTLRGVVRKLLDDETRFMIGDG